MNNFGAGFGELAKRNIAADESISKADRAVMLLNVGMKPEQVENILTAGQHRPIISGSAQAEYERLQKIVNQPAPQTQPSPQELQQQEQPKKTEIDEGIEQVRFNVVD